MINKQLSEKDPPERAIIGFHKDEENHWVADLDCGHGRHVRHDPPWQNREWVLSVETRLARIGAILKCKKCLADGPTSGPNSQAPADQKQPVSGS